MHGQDVVLDPHIDILLIDARDFNLQDDIVLVLVDIHRWSKLAGGQRLVPTFRSIGLTEQAVHAILQSGKLTEGIPTGNYSHSRKPPNS